MFETLLQKRDVCAGGLMALIGAGVAYDSAHYYDLGSLTHMGPGMFPLMIGAVLACIGVVMVAAALATAPSPVDHIAPRRREWRGWFCILAGPVLFILFGLGFGMAPATFMCVFVSALGDRTATLWGSAILAVAITGPGCLLFSYVLQLPFPIFRWGI